MTLAETKNGYRYISLHGLFSFSFSESQSSVIKFVDPETLRRERQQQLEVICDLVMLPTSSRYFDIWLTLSDVW